MPNGISPVSLPAVSVDAHPAAVDAVPVADYSPARVLARAAAQRPHRLSLVNASTGQQWTVAQAWRAVCQSAQVLQDAGISAGDRVAVVASNSPWHFIVHVAASLLHGVTVPLSPRLPRRQLRALLDDCQPRLILTEDSLVNQGVFYQDMVMSVQDFAQLTARVSPQFNGNIVPCHHHAAAIIYTSGSTGQPRGITLSHRHLWWASASFRDGFEYSPGTDIVGVAAPLSHIGGFNGTSLDVFSHGGTVVVFDSFDADLIVRSVDHYGITMMFAVPAMCYALIEAHTRLGTHLSTWTRPLIGGEKLSPVLAQDMKKAGLSPIHVWGMTETGGAGTFASPEMYEAHPGTIGQPFPYTDLRLVDQDEAVITGPNLVGTLQVRGPGVVSTPPTSAMEGSATQSTWLDTGDLAQWDDGGALHFVSRASRMINTGGELVAPAVVEEALRALPQVRDALVVGLPDERWGQIVAALLVPANTAKVRGAVDNGDEALSGLDAASRHESMLLGVDAIRSALAGELAPWQQVRHVVWTQRLPLTSTGKPDIAAAAAQLEQTRASIEA